MDEDSAEKISLYSDMLVMKLERMMNSPDLARNYGVTGLDIESRR